MKLLVMLVASTACSLGLAYGHVTVAVLSFLVGLFAATVKF